MACATWASNVLPRASKARRVISGVLIQGEAVRKGLRPVIVPAI
jgi:hypothetical protein